MPKQEKPTGEASIIQIIQDMVKEGESEEKIISTLKELGVESDKAKRLLLLGQADTFALLRSEISKIISTDMEKEIPKLMQKIEEEARKKEKELRTSLEKISDEQKNIFAQTVKKTEKQLATEFGEKVTTAIEVSEKVRNALNELGTQVYQSQKDLEEMKAKGIGTRNRLISILLVLLGIGFSLSALYLFFVTFQTAITVDTIIITVIMALIGVTMLFVSTII